MKKEKIIFFFKVTALYVLILTVFAFAFSKALNFIMPVILPTSLMGAVFGSLGFIVCLMAIALLAQTIALKLVKKPEEVQNI